MVFAKVNKEINKKKLTKNTQSNALLDLIYIKKGKRIY